MTSRLPALARRLRVLVWLGIVLLVAAPGLNWLDPALAERAPHFAGVWTVADRLAAWAIAAPPMLVVAVGLGQLLPFCRRVEEERVFTHAAADCIRRFGWAVIAAAVLFPLSRLAIGHYLGGDPTSAVAWWRLAGGQALMATAVGLALGLALLVFGAILREATRLAEENASFL